MKIKKAVIPVAGKGTRFLPATKEIPKEMLPLVDRPMIEYVVREAIESGIEEIVFITSNGKESIENYFDKNLELETFLEKNNKLKLLDEVKDVSRLTQVISVRQKFPNGLGDAILCAQSVIGKDDFAVLLPDDIISNNKPCLKQLIDIYQEKKSSCIAVMNVEKEEVDKYGIIEGSKVKDFLGLHLIKDMVEKPDPKSAPSTLACPGRYVFTNEIFGCLKEIPKIDGKEIQLTDAITILAKKRDVYAFEFEGKRYDTGRPLGQIIASIEFALIREDLSNELKSYLLGLIKSKGLE